MSRRCLVSTVAALLAIGLQPGGDAVRGQTRTPIASQHFDEALLSKPAHRVRIDNDVRVAMRDGVTLSVDVYRPDGPGQFPTILIRTPYNNNTEPAVVQGKWFAERGYVVVQADVRGKFDSGGDFYPFRHEPDDGFDTDEWVARQPWFNGKLGTMGGSYVGFTQWSQAIRGSRHLTAMAATVTTPDIYGNWFYTNGALNLAFALSWGAVSIDGRVAQFTGAYDWPRVYRTLPIADAPSAAGHRAPHYRDWVAHPTRDAHWNMLSHEDKYATVGVPILTVEGWYDIFLRGALQDHTAVRSQGRTDAAKKGKRLVIGPWVHATGRRNNTPAGQAADPERRGLRRRGRGRPAEGLPAVVRLLAQGRRQRRGDRRAGPDLRDGRQLRGATSRNGRWRARSSTKYYLHSGGRANTLLGDGTLQRPRPPRPRTPTGQLHLRSRATRCRR